MRADLLTGPRRGLGDVAHGKEATQDGKETSNATEKDRRRFRRQRSAAFRGPAGVRRIAGPDGLQLPRWQCPAGARPELPELGVEWRHSGERGQQWRDGPPPRPPP